MMMNLVGFGVGVVLVVIGCLALIASSATDKDGDKVQARRMLLPGVAMLAAGLFLMVAFR